jgi:hypothetical protein
MNDLSDSSYAIRPLDAGAILDHAIYLYRDHFKLVVAVLGILLLPALIVMDFFLLPYQARLEQAMEMGSMPPVESVLASFVYFVIYQFLLFPLVTGALVFGLAMRYMGKPATFTQCVRHMARRAGRLIAAGFIYQVVILVGSCLCVVPGIYASVIFIPILPIVTLEDTPVLSAFSRCNYLMQGERLKGLLILFVIFIISAAAGVLDLFTGMPYFSFVYADIVQALAMGLPIAIWLVFYFSARCRSENLDLDLAVQTLERQAAQEAPVL